MAERFLSFKLDCLACTKIAEIQYVSDSQCHQISQIPGLKRRDFLAVYPFFNYKVIFYL